MAPPLLEWYRKNGLNLENLGIPEWFAFHSQSIFDSVLSKWWLRIEKKKFQKIGIFSMNSLIYKSQRLWKCLFSADFFYIQSLFDRLIHFPFLRFNTWRHLSNGVKLLCYLLFQKVELIERDTISSLKIALNPFFIFPFNKWFSLYFYPCFFLSSFRNKQLFRFHILA